MAFPGQGSQKVGMTADFVDRQLAYLYQAGEILGYDIHQLCNDGPLQKLSLTEYAQPVLVAVCISKWSLLTEKVKPEIFLGHSLGELTAFIAAGAIDYADGIIIAAKRGVLMKRCSDDGKMAAVIGLELTAIEQIVNAAKNNGFVVLANYNSPRQFVISGQNKAVDHAAKLAMKAGAKKVIDLAVSGPFHSQLMEPVANEFANFLAAYTFKDPAIPVISNYSCRPITQGQDIKTELVNQLTKPVKWIDNVKYAEKLGINQIIEVGPSTVLTGLTKRISKNMNVIAVDKGMI